MHENKVLIKNCTVQIDINPNPNLHELIKRKVRKERYK